MNKVAIVGSSGYVGRNLNSILENYHEVIRFSHGSTFDYRGNGYSSKNHYSLQSLIKFSKEFDLIIFLLESKNNNDRKFIKKYLCNLLESAKNTKVIIFSSASVYSSLISQYVKFKLEIEKIGLSYKNAIIFRPGVIFGGLPGGLYKTFLSVKRKKFLILPSGDAITGYVHILSIAKTIIHILRSEVDEKIFPLIDIKLSFSDAIIFFGFRGYLISLPTKLTLSFFRPFKFLLKYFPTQIQSIMVLSTTSLPYLELKSIKDNHNHLRRMLLTQFFQVNKSVPLKFEVRKFIRELEANNSVDQLSDMLPSQRFIFFKRFFEIYKLSLQDAN